MERLEIIEGCAESRWVWIRYSADKMAGDTAQKFDIDLCDEAGMICVQIKGVELASNAGGQRTQMPETVSQKQWLFVQEQWIFKPFPDDVNWKERLEQCTGKTIS